LTPDRIGIRELQPGVWVGLHTHIAIGATLIAPCWIDECAWIEAGAVIGPHAVLEREVCVSHGAEISHSLIGPRTFVGKFTEVCHSIAWGPMLINWERDSCLKVTDEFLLSSLQPHHARPQPAVRQSVALRLRDYVNEVWTWVFAESRPPH
jgi:NDP-sugar pyrophosphorylase family protein